jgi:hypothetical protein
MSRKLEGLAFVQQVAHEHHNGPQDTCAVSACSRLRELAHETEANDAADETLRRAVERVAVPAPNATEVAPPGIRKLLQDALLAKASEAQGTRLQQLTRDNALLRTALEFGGQCSIGRLLRLEAVVGSVQVVMDAALKLWPTVDEIPEALRMPLTDLASSLTRMRVQGDEDPVATVRHLASINQRMTERFNTETRVREAARARVIAHAAKTAQECTRCGGSGTEQRLVVVEGAVANLLPCASCGEWRELLADAGVRLEAPASKTVSGG